MSDITPEELEELKALETWLRECRSPYSDGRFLAWAESVSALIRSAEELALRTAEVTALKAVNEEMRGRLEKAERALALAIPYVESTANMIVHSHPGTEIKETAKHVLGIVNNALSVYSKET